uniref:Uncharacterized protein n=1 Tax=Anopheles farauti TaxID=69004 RepID=A0A182Q7S8_9DIPT
MKKQAPSSGSLWHTYATARADGDLDRVAAGLAHLLQVERPVRVLVVAPVDLERRRVRRHLHARRPVRVHLPVLVVETLQLQLEIRPAHERVVDGRLQLEHVVADREIVLEPERWQQDAIAHRECQPQLLVFWWLFGFTSGLGLMYGVMEEAGVSGGVGTTTAAARTTHPHAHVHHLCHRVHLLMVPSVAGPTTSATTTHLVHAGHATRRSSAHSDARTHLTHWSHATTDATSTASDTTTTTNTSAAAHLLASSVAQTNDESNSNNKNPYYPGMEMLIASSEMEYNAQRSVGREGTRAKEATTVSFIETLTHPLTHPPAHSDDDAYAQAVPSPGDTEKSAVEASTATRHDGPGSRTMSAGKKVAALLLGTMATREERKVGVSTGRTKLNR